MKYIAASTKNAKKLALFDSIASNSELTEEDIEELDELIKTNIYNKYQQEMEKDSDGSGS